MFTKKNLQCCNKSVIERNGNSHTPVTVNGFALSSYNGERWCSADLLVGRSTKGRKPETLQCPNNYCAIRKKSKYMHGQFLFTLLYSHRVKFRVSNKYMTAWFVPSHTATKYAYSGISGLLRNHPIIPTESLARMPRGPNTKPGREGRALTAGSSPSTDENGQNWLTVDPEP